jgi:hypothetical protein
VHIKVEDIQKTMKGEACMKKINAALKGIYEVVIMYAECRMGKRGMVHFVSMAETKALFGSTKLESKMIDIMYNDLHSHNTPYMVIPHG